MNPFKRHQSFPLRLSPSIRLQAGEFAKKEGISLNHFISLAVAEKLSRLEHESFLSQQKPTLIRSGTLSQVPGGLRPTG
jgi:hypothetical protein